MAHGDATALQRLVEDVASYCFAQPSPEPPFPPALFDVVMESLEGGQFRAMAGSYHLLMLLEYDWGMLAADQKERLLPAMEAAYPDFTDWMACFVISELLGKYYADEKGFAALERLAAIQNERPRALVPVGLEHLARQAQNPELKRGAIHQLERLCEDLSDEVRREAAESLGRLRKRRND